MIPDIGPLEFLNSNLCLDFSNAATLPLGGENESNPYIDFKLNTNYHDEFSFKQKFSGTDKNVLLSLNIRSLMSNYDQFLLFMNKMAAKGVNIIAIALQEIWKVPYPELVQLPNFNFFHKTRTESRGCGVGFYFLNTYRCKIIKELVPYHGGGRRK
jgi:hypothetical protein